MSCRDEIQARWDQPAISIFHFDFQCDFASSPQWVNDFGFHSPFIRTQCISMKIFNLNILVHRDPMCNLSVPLIFLSSVFVFFCSAQLGREDQRRGKMCMYQTSIAIEPTKRTRKQGLHFLRLLYFIGYNTPDIAQKSI